MRGSDDRAAAPTLDVGGDALPVHVEGRGPWVLLIHGTAPPAWGRLPALLASDARVVTYTRRSFVGPPKVTPRSLSDHADDAAAVLDGLDARRAVVVGWSIGGVIALDLAVRRPDLVGSLVLLEPPLHAKRHPSPAMVRAILGARVRGALGRRSGGERFLAWALGRRTGGDDIDRLADGYRDLVRAAGPAILAELALGTGEHLRRDDLEAIGVPTAVVVGQESTREFAAAADRLLAATPAAQRFTAPGSGHAVAVDRPEIVAEIVRAQLRSVGASPGSGEPVS